MAMAKAPSPLKHLAERGLKPVAHLLCAMPLLWLVGRGLTDTLGANPIETVIRFLGDWSLRLLILALAITPLRKLTGWAALARIRRLTGLWAFALVVVHLVIWLGIDQELDGAAILREIVKRKFLTLGMIAALLLLPLAITSTNGMIRRLGGMRWRRLHRLVYLIVPLGGVHYLMMVKANLTPPLWHIAVILLLLGLRLWWARQKLRPDPRPA